MLTPDEFGTCEVCGDPASIIVPARSPSCGTLWRHAPWAEWREAIRNGGHFCSLECARRHQLERAAAA
jgi:hypothetical protein